MFSDSLIAAKGWELVSLKHRDIIRIIGTKSAVFRLKEVGQRQIYLKTWAVKEELMCFAAFSYYLPYSALL